MSLIDEYKKFIANADQIARNGLNNRKFKASASQKIQKLREDIKNELLSDKAIQAISYAASQISPQSVEFYTRELEFFNDQYQSDFSKDDKRASDDAKTLKDSAEKLLGDWLPDWLKDLLEIFNEILSLSA